MAQQVKLRRSSVAGNKPTTAQLELGELAINTNDGKLYFEKSSSLGESVQEIIVTDAWNTGSINVSGSVTVSGSINATSFTGSLFGTASYASNALSSSYALVSTSASYAATSTSASYAATASYYSGSLFAPGSTTQILYNNAGTIAGDSGLVYSGSRVGIGTTSPLYTLDVSGTARINGGLFNIGSTSDTWAASSAEGLAIKGSATNSAVQTITSYLDNTSIRIGAGISQKTGILINGQTSASGSSVLISTGGATRLTINSTGAATFSAGVTATSFTGSLQGTASYATQALSASYALNTTSASYALNTTSASYALISTSASYANNATSASYALNTTSASYAETASYANNFTVAGTLTAQTLVVQTITSSIIYSSGSNKFGNDLGNTQVFTGSLYQTGSVAVFMGNVGIGTTNPAAKLQVEGVNSNGLIQAYVTSGGGNALRLNSNFGGGNYIDLNPYISGVSNGGFEITQNGTQRFVIADATGNVGIGTTNPNNTLQVVGGVTATSFTGSLFGTASYATNALSSSYALTATSASYALTATSASYAEVAISASYFSGSISTAISSSYAATASYYSGSLFAPGSTTQILYNNAGTVAGDSGLVYSGSRVGIGTTSPLYTLDVSGTARVFGQATFNDSLTLSGATPQIFLNRTANTNSNALLYQTNSTYDWFIGSNPLGANDSDYNFYSYGTSSIVLKLAKSTGAATFSAGVTATSFTGSLLGTATNAISASYAATSSYADNFTVAGTLTAQTLVVQTITSSTVYSSGSNIFGNSVANTQVFTGSLYQTGSVASFMGSVGIGTTNPLSKLYVEGGSADWSLPTPGTAVGTIHLDPGVDTDNFGNAITFGASDSSAGATAMAGIYVRTDGAYGSKMYFGTTDSYAAGSKIAVTIDESQRVGIGTTSPNNTLQVVGGVTATSFTGSLFGTSSYAVQALSASYFSGSVTNTISSSYALSASFATTASYYGGTVISASYALTATSASFATTAISASYFSGSVSNAISASYATTASYAILAATASYFSGSLSAPGSTTQILYNNGGTVAGDSGLVYSGSNVGIGTTSPFSNAKLQVRPASDANIAFQPSTTLADGIKINAFNDAANTNINLEINGLNLALKTTETERIRVTSTGNVGIGITNPGSLLQVGPSTSNQPSLVASLGGTASGILSALSLVNTTGNSAAGYGTALDFHVNHAYSPTGRIATLAENTGTEAALAFYTYNSGLNEKMRITSDGKVGIGTTGPGAKLDIVSTGAASEGLRVDGTGGGFAFVVKGGSDYTSHIRAGATIGVNYFTTPPSNGLIVEGNVGIGTTSPTAKLDIKGDLIVSSSLIINQNTASLGSGAQTISTNATSSYTAAFYNYTVASGSNARAGQVTAVWNGGSIQYTDVSTTDIGSTLAVAFTASLSGANVQLTTVLPTSGWTVKTLANLI